VVLAHISRDLQDNKLTTQANKPIVITAIHKPFFTRATRAVVDDRLHTHAVSNSEAFRDTFSHLFNGAREFVTER
jgi:hypothetical protein